MNKRLAVPVLFGALVLVMLLVYWNHFDNPFQFDDHHTIVNNSAITDIGNVPRFFVDATTTSALPLNQEYRPVVTSLNAFDYWLAGRLDVRVFHWHIFTEFILILLLIFLMASRLFRLASGEPHPYLALLAAAFFGLHTATAETINYVIARSDVFSTLLVLLGMLLFMRHKGWKRHWAILPFVVGSLAKPTGLMLAPLIAMYALLMMRPAFLVRDEQPAAGIAVKRAALLSLPYFVIGAVLFAFGRSMTPDTYTPGGNYSGLDYLLTQAWVIWIYIKTFAWPTGLTADTDLQVIRDVMDPRILWGLLVILLLLGAAILAALRRITLPIAFGILWFFIALAPSSSIIPLAEVMNHHRTFFAYIGLVIAVVWAAYLLLARFAKGRPRPALSWLTGIVIAVLLAGHAWGTVLRNEVWDSEESLWQDAIIKSPNNGRALMNYGLTLMRKGDMQSAVAYFERARDSNYGNHPFVFVNLAIATASLAEREQSEPLRRQAEDYYLQALQKGPNYPESYYWYAKWLHDQGRDGEAAGFLNTAIEIAPGNKGALELRDVLLKSEAVGLQQARAYAEQANSPEAWIDLSLRYYNQGAYRECIDTAGKALELRSDYAVAYNNICSAHIMLGEYDEAISACESALALDPGFERAANNLAWAKREKEKR